jgi:hypothetical protein
MPAPTHGDGKALLMCVSDHPDNVLDRSRLENGTRQATHDAALVRRCEFEGRVFVDDRSVQRGQPLQGGWLLNVVQRPPQIPAAQT